MAGERKRVGIVYSYDEKWIGGTYYIINLIQALKLLADKEQPELIILSNSKESYEQLAAETQYPYLTFYDTHIQFKFYEKLVNRIYRNLFKKNFFEKRPDDTLTDLLFPFSYGVSWDFELFKNRVYWIPDFQEYHLPHLFDTAEIKARKKMQEEIAASKLPLVLSSEDAFKDFKQAFPAHQNKVFILNFAVTHPDYQNIDSSALKEKYQIDTPYFIICNQFWIHKNFEVAIKALAKVVKEQNVKLVMTGKTHDPRNPEYVKGIQQLIEELNIKENIVFTGFMDRKEQLKLISGAQALIQPSLFEGWNTSIEDAKAIGIPVIASNLGVHQEQLKEKGKYFTAEDEEELAQQMLHVLKEDSTSIDYQYDVQRKEFSANFAKIIDHTFE